MENAISCLKEKAENIKTANALALLAYTFSLSGDSEMRDKMLTRLDGHADKYSK